MAILDVFKKEDGKEKKSTTPKAERVSKKSTAAQSEPKGRPTVRPETHLLIKPYITEKATVLADGRNIYTFHVEHSANKNEIKKAVKTLYGVDAVKVAVVNLPARRVMRRGVPGTKAAKKKALVYLKKGDTIEFA